MILFHLSRDAQVIQGRKYFGHCHALCFVGLHAPAKKLLCNLVGVLWSIFKQCENLHLTLLVMIQNFFGAIGQIDKRLAMSGQDNTGRQCRNFPQRVFVIAQRILALVFRIEANVRGDAWQDMIGGQENTIALTEEADMTIRVSWRPNHAVTLTYQVDVLSIFDECKRLVWWNANDVVHDMRVYL